MAFSTKLLVSNLCNDLITYWREYFLGACNQTGKAEVFSFMKGEGSNYTGGLISSNFE